MKLCEGSGKEVKVAGDTTRYAKCSVCKLPVTPIQKGSKLIAKDHVE